MRLIDADALLKGHQDHEMISTHLVWNAPTVDAIPIEWINRAEKDKAYQMYDWSEILSIVYRWRKEQSNEID